MKEFLKYKLLTKQFELDKTVNTLTFYYKIIRKELYEKQSINLEASLGTYLKHEQEEEREDN